MKRRDFLVGLAAGGLPGRYSPGRNDATVASDNVNHCSPLFSCRPWLDAKSGYGASSDGLANAAPGIQAALDAADTRLGGVVHVPSGTYRVDAPLKIGSNTTVVMAPDALVLRNFSGNGSQLATIRNKLQSGAGNADIRVIGGRFQASSSVNTGRHLGFVQVDRLLVQNIAFAGVYGDWNTAFENVYHAIITGLAVNSGTTLYTDGIHIRSGRWITISDCVVSCGDDCIAFAQEDESQDHIQDVVVTNSVVQSAVARGIICYTSTAKEVRNVAISNVTGSATGTYGILIQDNSATPASRVHDITVTNVQLDLSATPISVFADGCHIESADRIWLDNVNMQSPTGPAFGIKGSSDVYLKGGQGTPRAAGSQNLLAQRSTNVNVRDCNFARATQHGIHFTSVTGGSVTGCRVISPEDTSLALTDCIGIRVFGNEFGGGVWGIREDGTSDHNVFYGNWVRSRRDGAGPALTSAAANSQWAHNMGYSKGLMIGSNHSVTIGASAPDIHTMGSAPVTGDYYLRTDTPNVPGQRVYVCIAGGPTATWLGIL